MQPELPTKTIDKILDFIFAFFSSKINSTAFVASITASAELIQQYVQNGQFSWPSAIYLVCAIIIILFRTFEKYHKPLI